MVGKNPFSQSGLFTSNDALRHCLLDFFVILGANISKKESVVLYTKCKSHLFGDECWISVLSDNRYVAVIQEVESFI